MVCKFKSNVWHGVGTHSDNTAARDCHTYVREHMQNTDKRPELFSKAGPDDTYTIYWSKEKCRVP